MPEWVDDFGGGLRDINGNFHIEHTRCATAHLSYFTVNHRFGDSWGNVAERATLSDAREYAEDYVADKGWSNHSRWAEDTNEVPSDNPPRPPREVREMVKLIELLKEAGTGASELHAKLMSDDELYKKR